jgi:hypothetical protein
MQEPQVPPHTAFRHGLLAASFLVLIGYVLTAVSHWDHPGVADFIVAVATLPTLVWLRKAAR